MRITGGALGGRRLRTPDTADIRPMRDQVRMALFNILTDVVVDSLFLDLFAGTGSVGLEALSRGAARAVFVDRGRDALQLLKQNVDELGVAERAEIIADDVFNALDRFDPESETFDLVFIGPPYGYDLAPKTLRQLGHGDVLAPDAIVITEVFKKESVSERYDDLHLFDERRYGDNRLILYRRGADAGESRASTGQGADPDRSDGADCGKPKTRSKRSNAERSP